MRGQGDSEGLGVRLHPTGLSRFTTRAETRLKHALDADNQAPSVWRRQTIRRPRRTGKWNGDHAPGDRPGLSPGMHAPGSEEVSHSSRSVAGEDPVLDFKMGNPQGWTEAE